LTKYLFDEGEMHCKKCNTDKPESEFYSSNKTRCKECIKASVNKHRAENLERVREYDRMRGSMPHRVAARKDYQKTPAFAESHEAAAKRWAAKYPERRKASHDVGNAIRHGKLKKQPCWVCGEKAEAHHPDYSRPLDVVWLCNPHHREVHAMAA
jgi:hypothetical protein